MGRFFYFFFADILSAQYVFRRSVVLPHAALWGKGDVGCRGGREGQPGKIVDLPVLPVARPFAYFASFWRFPIGVFQAKQTGMIIAVFVVSCFMNFRAVVTAPAAGIILSISQRRGICAVVGIAFLPCEN